MRKRLGLLIIGACTACGCPRTKPVEVESFDPEACAELVLPTGMGLRWQRFNHRISKWEVALAENRDEDCGPDAVVAALVGGGFSKEGGIRDRPWLELTAQRVTTDVHDAGIARLSVNEILDGEASVRGTKVIQRNEYNLRHYEHIAALIEGIAFDTGIEQAPDYPADYDPTNGYTSRGLGASVEVADFDEHTITLEYEIRFETGASPDRLKMNEARPHARIGARLDLAVIATGPGVQPNTQPVEYTVTFPKPKLGNKRQALPENIDGTVTFDDAEPGVGVVGWSAFNFALDFSEKCTGNRRCPAGDRCADGRCMRLMGLPGDYIRELSIALEPVEPEGGDGGGGLEVEAAGFAANNSESIAFEALTYTFTARVTYVPLPVVPEPVSVTTHFPTGNAKIPF